jgi:hypothetical protein
MSISSLQLLIVEDEPIIALHLHQIVTELGYVVLATVGSGEEYEIEATLKRVCVSLQHSDPMHEPEGVADAPRQLQAQVLEIAACRLPACEEDRQFVEDAVVVAIEAVRLAIKALHRATETLRQIREH